MQLQENFVIYNLIQASKEHFQLLNRQKITKLLQQKINFFS